MRVGCAGWAIPKQHAALFAVDGSQLARYASCFDAVEINSSFYRAHRSTTYTRWATSVPGDFSFSIKVPKEITHLRKLVDTDDVLSTFLEEVQSLGPKCGPLLFQLPPGLQFDRHVAATFFGSLRKMYLNAAVCEARHPSWFTGEASEVLKSFSISRVVADPAIMPSHPQQTSNQLMYYRLHGSPHMYYSNYTEGFLSSLIETMLTHRHVDTIWCIFDNTAAGCAVENAHYLQEQLQLRLSGRSQQ